jgi:hypothetical protein
MPRVRRRLAGCVVLLGALGGAAAQARAAPDDPRAAVRYARNAFEYRDFDKVVEVLWPWLHPPRIVDAGLAIRARELLGISLFILGREAEAREEFSSMLLLDPDHALDPFLVPPDVIQAFEDVKQAMEPTLRALRDKEPVAPPEPERTRVRREIVEVPPPAVVLLPLGGPQFVLGEPAWGGFWLGAQVAGLGLNAAAFWQADALRSEDPDYDTWVALQYVGLGVTVAAYVGSLIQGAELLRDRRRTARRSVEQTNGAAEAGRAEASP